tara:strand:+ start:325 stop:4605 length:4281 start_codon:yes stop_codon:yes gene_type:complete
MTTGNPISGHTNANAGGSGDGLSDGNHLVSASLTNLYEGVLGNGILMTASTDGDDSARNTPTSLPGYVSVSGVRVTIQGGLAVMDGVAFEFANGEGNNVYFDIGNAADFLKGSDTALNGSTRDEVYYTVYIAPEVNGTNRRVYYVQGTAIDTASATYADTPSGHLNDPNNTSSVSAKTSITLATLKCTYSSGGGNSKVQVDKVSDKRVFVRPTPLYLTPTLAYNASGAGTPVDSAADLDAIHNGATGNINDSDVHAGALWLSDVGTSATEVQALYFSGKRASATRFDRTLETRPTVTESSPSGTTTFTYENGRVFILTPSTAVQFNPSGDFPTGYTVYVSNRSASNAITFDIINTAATATVTVADGDAASGISEKQTIVLESTDGTSKTYVVVDDNATTVATGDILSSGSDTGASTAGGALAGGIAVAINLTGSTSTQNTFLVQLKAAIEHANGHNGKITVSSVPGSADGAQSITLTQGTQGGAGNTTVTEGLANVTATSFSGGKGISDALAALESAIYVYDGAVWQRALVGTSTHPTGDITAVTAGVGLSGGGTSGAVTLTLDLSELSTVTPANGDFFSTLDSDGSTEQKTEVSALATLFAGDGLTASSSVMAVGAGNLIDVQANQVDVDLTEAAAATIAAGDNVIFLDGGASGTQSKGSVNDIATLFAGTASSTGLSASSGVMSVSDLHPVGVDGSANQILTDDGDGTVTSESKLTFDGSTLTVNTDFTGTTTATTKGAFIDFDATGITASGQTATNIGLDLDLNTDSPTMVGTVNNTGLDVDLTGGTSGAQTNIGVDVAVAGADENYAAKLTGGSLLLGTLSAAPADVSTYGQLWVKDNGSGSANTELYFTNDNGDDIQITNDDALAGGGGGAVSAVANGSDNRIATFSSSDALNGEANLTFDGNQLVVGTAHTTTDMIDVNANSITTASIMDISGTGLTDGKLLNAATTSTVTDGGTSTVISAALTNDGVGSQTAKGLLLDYNKSGVTASGKTATVTGVHVDIDDSATNHASGTVTMTGMDVDVTSANAQGTIKNIGLDVAVAGADTNYAALFSGGNVGISEATPDAALHVTTSVSNSASVIFENTHTDTNAGPILQLYRNPSDSATTSGDLIGRVEFKGHLFDGGSDYSATRIWASIASEIEHYQGDGSVRFDVLRNGTETTYLKVNGNLQDIVFNEGATSDFDFRVEGNSDTHLLFTDGTADAVGIGTSAPEAKLEVLNTAASSATTGGSLRLSANDGAVMADDHRLGVIEFAGAEDTSSTMTVGARIEAICDATWSASENGASLLFYTTDGNATQSEVMRITSDKFVGIGTDAPNQPLTIEGTMSMKEQANANADVAAYGQLWIKSDTPNSLYFTDDAGNDVAIAGGAKLMSGTGLYTDGTAALLGGTAWGGSGAPTTVDAAINRIAARIVGGGSGQIN